MWRRRLVIALVVVAAVVAFVLALAATRPPTIVIERSVDIHAPSDRIFPLVDDLRRWTEWPTGDAQSDAAKTYGSISRGRGATAEWSGAGSAGAGRMEITESTPPSKVVVTVDFTRPFIAHNVNEFTLTPGTDLTHVTWTWRGQNVFMLRLMSVFVRPDRMIGSHFESGLQALKRRAESP